MTLACDGEMRLEGVSYLMKIQVRVGPSRIAGQGIFAAQDIHKGTRIIQYIGGKISSRERALRLAAGNAYIFHLTYRYAIDGQTLENTARYINHSCDPNCEVEKTPDMYLSKSNFIFLCSTPTNGQERTMKKHMLKYLPSGLSHGGRSLQGKN